MHRVFYFLGSKFDGQGLPDTATVEMIRSEPIKKTRERLLIGRYEGMQNKSYAYFLKSVIQGPISASFWTGLDLSKLNVSQLVMLLFVRYVQPEDINVLTDLSYLQSPEGSQTDPFEQYQLCLTKLDINHLWKLSLASDNWCQICSATSIAKSAFKYYVKLPGPYHDNIQDTWNSFTGTKCN